MLDCETNATYSLACKWHPHVSLFDMDMGGERELLK
jgi:hypothetical protein